MNSPASVWHRWLSSQVQWLVVWLVLLFLLQGFRVHLLLTQYDLFAANLDGLSWFRAWFMSLRFDSSVATILLLPLWLVQSFWSLLTVWQSNDFIRKYYFLTTQSLQYYYSLGVGAILILICTINIPFFEEYHEHFNYFVFEGLYDDPIAILQTVLFNGSLIISMAVALILFFVYRSLVTRIINRYPWQWSLAQNCLGCRLLFVLLVVVVLITCARGSLYGRPVMRKWADVTVDADLNKFILNPLRALHYAYRDYQELSAVGQGNPFSAVFKPEQLEWQIFERITQNALSKSPQHVVLILMESYDAWPLMPRYRPLKLSNEVTSLADQGWHFDRFVPASKSTMNSLVSLVSGVAYPGVNHSRPLSQGGPSDFSLFEIFKQLGYDTYFFYGGFLSWQNVGAFVRNQGAQHIFAAPHKGGKSTTGVWGIDDDQLFELVLEKLPSDRKTFSLILTTSYHGPYTVDLAAHGYPQKRLEYLSQQTSVPIESNSMTPIEMGHLWYSDHAIGQFVRATELRLPNTLFALTGDHFGRRFIHSEPNPYERSAVPFILYPSKMLPTKKPPKVAGTHIDVTPTLVDLVAPRGFHFKSQGQSLLQKPIDNPAIGFQAYITKDQLFVFQKDRMPIIWPHPSMPTAEHPHEYQRRYHFHMGLNWHLAFEQPPASGKSHPALSTR